MTPHARERLGSTKKSCPMAKPGEKPATPKAMIHYTSLSLAVKNLSYEIAAKSLVGAYCRVEGTRGRSCSGKFGEQWLRDDADARLHGTVREMVCERFKSEALHLHPLAQGRDDASYREQRFVHWDGYVDVRGNRYSVPDHLSGSTVEVCIGLRGELAVYAGEQVVTRQRVRSASGGWVTMHGHHWGLWQKALSVEGRDLTVYEDVAQCN